MPECWPATQVGDSFRYEWESEDDPGPATRFGFTGELLELDENGESSDEHASGRQGEQRQGQLRRGRWTSRAGC